HGASVRGPRAMSSACVLGGCSGADGLHDEVGAAFEQQVEQAGRAEEPGGTAEQSDEARLVQPDGTGCLHGLAHAGRDRAARAELPGRIEPFAAVPHSEELTAVAQLLDLARVDAEPA